MTGSIPRRAGWIPELAGYRALAALAVFGFHLASIDPPGGVIGRLSVPLGNAAVSLFFVLSGFLLYRPFADWALVGGPPVVTWRFVARRVARIMPLYWVVLTVHFLLTEPDQPLGLGEYLTSYLLVQNFRGSLVFLPPFVAWSLCIELWFSFALPLIAAPLRRFGRSRPLVERCQIQLLGLAFVAGSSIVFRIWALTSPGDGRVLWMPAYLDWFAAGLVLAVLSSYWTIRPPELAVRQLAANPWFLSSLGLIAYWTVSQLGLPGGFVAPTRFQTHSQFLLQGLMSLLLVGAVVLPGADLGAARRFFGSRTLQWLGSISYGIYLIHPVITDELIEHFPATPLGLIAPFALGATLTMAALLHYTVEAPASRFVDRLVVPRRRTGLIERSERSPRTEEPVDPPASEGVQPTAVLRTTGVQSLLVAALAFASPLLSLQNRYVGDSRFELTFAPAARLERMFVGWDAERGLGRPAEEFWPFLTFLSSGLDWAGVPPWILQRLVHGSLLALAGVGMVLLTSSLDSRRRYAPIAAAVLYTFGPASSIYLLPIPLYTSYAAAPWLALAVVRASNGRPIRWAGFVAIVIFLAGNADPPGLAIAALPAATIGITVLVTRRAARRRLVTFALVVIVLTGLSSAAMLAKTSIGSAPLAHRLNETESIEAVASASSFAESIRGAGFWLLYFRLSPTAFRDHLQLFVTNGWMVVATVVPLAVGIAGIRRRTGRARLLALAWVLLGVVLMVGPYPTDDPTPWGQALLELFRSGDAAFAFRSSHKAGVILAMGTSLLAAWAMQDLARAVRRLGRWRRTSASAAVGLAAVIFATVAAPFWTTPLYDTALSTPRIPDYWSGAAAQLAEEADGRVMVIPGSTNNGYRWGTVGDDIVDVLVPSPLVASTLPLSTPLPADVVDALDDVLTSPDYQPGTLSPIAHRLGITHLVIRNDLEWEIQGLPRPAILDAVRGDPDLTLVGRHGTPGRFVANPLAPDESELSLSPIEIYQIGGAEPPLTTVLPSTGEPRTILVDGTGAALVRLAEERLLDGGHIVRSAATVEPDDALLDDIALVVITGTTRSVDRRIEYYDYVFAPAADRVDANAWLGLDGPGEVTVVDLDGGAVASSVDRWLLGVEHQPQRAFDGDPSTAWLVPRLAQDRAHQLSLAFDEPTAIVNGSVLLIDDGQRIEDLRVSVDGSPVGAEIVDGVVSLPPGQLSELTIDIRSIRPGVSAVGVAEVRLDLDGRGRLGLVVRYPQGIADLAGNIPSDPPALFLLGPDRPSERPVTVEFHTWRKEPHQLSMTLQTNASATRCLPLVEIDGVEARMLIRPNGDGTASAEPCGLHDGFDLEPGDHRITVTPPEGDALVGLRLSSGELDLASVATIPLADDLDLRVGDLVVLPHSHDPGWTVEASGTGAVESEPFVAHGLAAFTITEDTAAESGTALTSVHRSDTVVDRAWWVTLVGLGLTVLAISSDGRSLPRLPRSGRFGRVRRPREWNRFVSSALPAVGVLVAWLWVGPIGMAGAALGWAAERRLPGRAFAAAAVGLLAVTVHRAWPLVVSNVDQIDPSRGDWAIRAIVGVLTAAGAEAVRRQ